MSHPPQKQHTCSRRNFLRSLPLLSFPLSTFAAPQPPSSTLDPRAQVQGELPLAEFVKRVEAGDVLGVWFYGTSAEYCVFKTMDGRFWHVGEGYPVEDPKSNQSPLQMVARVRNLGVPYFVGTPVDATFLKKR